MSSFSLEKQLPSVHVSRELLEQLERYLRERIQEAFSGEAPHRESFQVTITDATGSESVSTLSDYTTHGVAVVVERWHSSNRKIDIRIHFHRKPASAKVRISAAMPGAREAAVSFEQGILRLLEPYSTLNWLLQPSAWFEATVFALVCGLAVFAARNVVGHQAASCGAAFIALLLSCYLLARYLWPYQSFDTARFQGFVSWRSWFVRGLLAFLLFATLLTAAREEFLSWLGQGAA